jgi:hypothetical protein
MSFEKVRYTENMRKLLITLSLFFISQGCELLQKRDIDPADIVDKESRNFKVLSYIFVEQFAVSEASDSSRYIRNQLSSINSATLVTTKESSFSPWYTPQMRCLAINTGDLSLQRIRLNLNMGLMKLKSESTLQEANITAQETTVGTVYGAWGWLPPSLYTYTFGGTTPVMAWSENAVPSISPGSEIEFQINGAWQRSASPNLDLSEHFVVKTDEDFKTRYRGPEFSAYAIMTLTDSVGNSIRCYGEPSGEISVPKESLAQLTLGTGASIELKFVSPRMTKTHPKIDEIYIESSSKHAFGKIYISKDQALDFGTVEISN